MRTASEVLEVFERFKLRGGRFSVSVKSYKGPADLSAEQWDELRKELGLEGEELDGLPFGPEWIETQAEDYGPAQLAAEDAWENGAEYVRELFGRGVELFSDGRSGGHAVLHGIDAADMLSRARAAVELESVLDRLQRTRAVLHYYDRGDVSLANRLAAEHGLLVPIDRAGMEAHRQTMRARVRELVRELELGDMEERIRCADDLRDMEWRTRESAETVARILASSRAFLGLGEADAVPELEDFEPTFPELDSLADKLEEWARYCASAVADFPWQIAWHYGANSFEHKLQDSKELDARGALVSELLHSADRLADSIGQHGETGPDYGPARACYESARRAFVHGIGEVGEVLSLRLSASGRRPAVPCAKCGEPVRFKWASSETLCGDCQCES